MDFALDYMQQMGVFATTWFKIPSETYQSVLPISIGLGGAKVGLFVKIGSFVAENQSVG
jgi:hypothetical protein